MSGPLKKIQIQESDIEMNSESDYDPEEMPITIIPKFEFSKEQRRQLFEFFKNEISRNVEWHSYSDFQKHLSSCNTSCPDCMVKCDMCQHDFTCEEYWPHKKNCQEEMDENAHDSDELPRVFRV